MVLPNAVPQQHPPAVAQKAPRLAFIDNIRWSMIILVISMHAADTYSPLGNWYYQDRSPIGTATLLTFAAWQMYLQAFFMGLLFFVSGVFSPASLDRKGPTQFIRGRAFRLGLPVLFYMFVLGPITEYYVAHSWTAPYSFAHEWWHHIIDLEVLQENGPLWFCLALLIFSIVYAGLRPRRKAMSARPEPTRTPDTTMLIGFALAMAAARFLLRLVLPANASFLNMHLGDFAQYILLFAAGIVAARRDWLHTLPLSSGLRWLLLVLPLGFVGWLALLATGGALSGGFDAYVSGWHWQGAALSLWESFTCVAISYGVLVLYRTKFNTHGPWARFLSDNAFSVYVFHPPIVIIGARLLHGFEWPPLVKFLTLTIVSTITTFALSAVLFRRIPILRSILA